jgi:Ion channel.
VGELDLIGGIYFSVITIATVGFGDIVPVSSAARLMVVGEVLLGVAYAVFFFSIIAAFLREKNV